MDETFEKALAFCLKWEGGFSDDPNDFGGRTMKGITQYEYNIYRQLKGLSSNDVASITDDEVRGIYYHNYYMASGCHLIQNFGSKLANAIFDWSVNAGVHRGVDTLQAVSGSDDDGVFGPKTLNDVKYAVSKRGEDEIVIRYQQLRRATYIRWGVGTQETFLQGWLNRCDDLSKMLLGHAV